MAASPGGAITSEGVEGLLIDLDGTVYHGAALIPGAAEAVRRLKDAGLSVLFTTNTSRKSHSDIVRLLAEMGLEVEAGAVFSAPVAAAEHLRANGIRRVQLLLPASTHADFADFDVTDVEPEVVLVGDLGDGFTFGRLNAAFRSLRGGAALIAVHKNRFWLPENGPTLDAGPFVAALEYAARAEALLVGKPSPAFFEAAALRTGVPLERLAVVGDDAESDVRGARAAGLVAIQVRTGKFDHAAEQDRSPDELPHHVVDSLADLPALLHV